MKFVLRCALLGAGLLFIPPPAEASPLLVLQETARVPTDRSMVAIEANLSLSGVAGLRGVEVRAPLPRGQGESLSLSPGTGLEPWRAVLLPVRRLGNPPADVFAVLFPNAASLDGTDTPCSIGVLRCTAGVDAGVPSVTAVAIASDGSRIEIPVTYERDLGRRFGARGLAVLPNPMFDDVEIHYRLATPSWVTVAVYDVRGGKVRSVFAGTQDSGDHSTRWDGRNQSHQLVPAGVYFVNVHAGEAVRTESVVLMR